MTQAWEERKLGVCVERKIILNSTIDSDAYLHVHEINIVLLFFSVFVS